MRMFMSFFKKLVLFLLVVFILPACLSFAVWQADASRPNSWRAADWSSAHILSDVEHTPEAVIHVMAAKTGRWKGAFSVHSWLVMKEKNATAYDRFEVVGWGTPIRQNAYPPDARWYSNMPEIHHTIQGDAAERLIPKIKQAISRYPHADYGDYIIWPGPNSNSFVAYLMNHVTELNQTLPSNAVGRDYLGHGRWVQLDPSWKNVQVSLFGYAGFAVGRRHGLELNFLGLVAGFDFSKPGLKVPGFGSLRF